MTIKPAQEQYAFEIEQETTQIITDTDNNLEKRVVECERRLDKISASFGGKF